MPSKLIVLRVLLLSGLQQTEVRSVCVCVFTSTFFYTNTSDFTLHYSWIILVLFFFMFQTPFSKIKKTSGPTISNKHIN